MLRKSDIKALPKLLVALATAAAFSLAHLAKANLITNGGFETGDFTGWTQSRGFVEGETFGITPHSGNFQATFGAAEWFPHSVRCDDSRCVLHH